MKIVNEKALVRYASSGGPADKEGYLHKKGKANKGYKKRWFVLKGNLLFYYEKKGEREPIGVIVLEGCTIELAEDLDNFTFQIKFLGSSKLNMFSAETQPIMESWMKALSTAEYEYVRFMFGELQQKLVEAISKEEIITIEEAKRQSRVFFKTYSEGRGRMEAQTRCSSPRGRRGSWNQRASQRLSCGSEWGTQDTVLEAGSQSPSRSFLELHEEIMEQVVRLEREWRSQLEDKNTGLNELSLQVPN